MTGNLVAAINGFGGSAKQNEGNLDRTDAEDLKYIFRRHQGRISIWLQAHCSLKCDLTLFGNKKIRGLMSPIMLFLSRR
jgi:hypothetical protein